MSVRLASASSGLQPLCPEVVLPYLPAGHELDADPHAPAQLMGVGLLDLVLGVVLGLLLLRVLMAFLPLHLYLPSAQCPFLRLQLVSGTLADSGPP